MHKIDYKIVLIIIGIIISFLLFCVISVQVVKNVTIDLEEQVAVAKSNIDVQQKRRADLIPNLVDCVKAYDKHEYETLMAAISARNMSNDAQVSEVQTLVAAVAEAYPELKSSKNYRELMNELSLTENAIANYRNNYNYQVRAYKNYIRRFPNSFMLALSNYDVLNYDYLVFNAPESAPTNLFD